MSSVLQDLYSKIKERKSANPETSYSARLFEHGTNHICQKVGEEAVETVISALSGTKQDLIEESADLVYHLLVLWADAEIEPEIIWDELLRRSGQSGLEEKSQRSNNK
jgi:phosphoribosyl-ATP pyrophosphohydrolase